MPTYSYARCLKNSYKVNWKIDELLGDRRLDLSRRWLPEELTGGIHLPSLGPREKRALSQVEFASYAHLFAYVEGFVAPKVSELALELAVDGREAYDALTNFAAEEIKHMTMFRCLRDRVNETLDLEARLIGDEDETTRYVLGKSTGAVLLLTAALEWVSQLHFTAAFSRDAECDSFTKDVFRAHWQEESQHAQMDHLETLRWFDGADEAERERAVTDLIELIASVDGLLTEQSGYDAENYAEFTDRPLSGVELAALANGIHRAKRWTFIESGLEHPRFQELFVEVTTPAHRERVSGALREVLGRAA